MKKLTTTMMERTLNKQDGRLTIGLDLGDRSSFYCVLDEPGDILLEQRVSTTPKTIREIFGAMPRSRIALETGTHSPWVSRLLSELGHESIVAHARSVRLIGESRRKDDRLDARTLARLVRIHPELLCPVKHRSAAAQADLTVIRARAALVRTRTMLVNVARGLTKSYGERLHGCNARGMKPKAAQDLSTELKRGQFERRFLHQVGMPPRLFVRIARFEAALEYKARNATSSWTEIAHRFGYYDQMLMVHDFAEFTGATPSETLNQLEAVYVEQVRSMRAGGAQPELRSLRLVF